MCALSPESQPYPGLHQKKQSQQVKRGDSTPLLRCGETLPRVLNPAPESSARKRPGPVGFGSEEGHKDDLRAGAPFL